MSVGQSPNGDSFFLSDNAIDPSQFVSGIGNARRSMCDDSAADFRFVVGRVDLSDLQRREQTKRISSTFVWKTPRRRVRSGRAKSRLIAVVSASTRSTKRHEFEFGSWPSSTISSNVTSIELNAFWTSIGTGQNLLCRCNSDNCTLKWRTAEKFAQGVAFPRAFVEQT